MIAKSCFFSDIGRQVKKYTRTASFSAVLLHTGWYWNIIEIKLCTNCHNSIRKRDDQMQENYELVQSGFRLLVSAMSGYIGQEFRKTYRDGWWEEALITLSDQYDLPRNGSYGELVDSLDIANCIRLIDRRWADVFRHTLIRTCRSWANELMAVRNIVAHLGSQDLEQPIAERALNTMMLLCREMDSDTAEEIEELYRTVRAKATPSVEVAPFTGLEQPESASKRGTALENSLLSLVGTDVVQKTMLTRKVPLGGKDVVYPVYRVRLDALYYNDQNDRIATWITRYEAENGQESLSNLPTDIYNRVIENFICESNPDAIQKTQKNIALMGQREPGVTLADGRIVDGNRRYTCLRRLQRDIREPQYFETVLLDVDIYADKKQIKLLELSIQHGEEKKLDYDQMDYAIGTYRDIIQTQLLTVEEYARSADESETVVRKRLEIAGMTCEFLDYLHLHEQYHVAREYKVYDMFQEMMVPIKHLEPGEQNQLKQIVFNNTMMGAIPDQRKFIRDIKGLIKNNTYAAYFVEQKQLSEKLQESFQKREVHSKADVDAFAKENASMVEDMQASMERALQRSRSQQLKEKPAEHVSKCISLMLDVDPRLFGKMSPEERETLRAELDELKNIAENFQKLL